MTTKEIPKRRKISARRFTRQFLTLPYFNRVSMAKSLGLISSSEVLPSDGRTLSRTIFARAKARDEADDMIRKLYDATREEYRRRGEEWE